MELIRTKSRYDVPAFDREILNENLHTQSVEDVFNNDPN